MRQKIVKSYIRSLHLPTKIIKQKFVSPNVQADISQNKGGSRHFQSSIPIFAEGRFGLTVVDAERFILNLCMGCATSQGEVNVDKYYVTNQMMGSLVANTKGLITRVVANRGMGINDISAHLTEFASILKPELDTFFTTYGLAVKEFYVTNINIDESTPAGAKIREAITSQTSQRISGHSWQQEQMVNMMNNAIDQMGNGGGGSLMSAVVASSILNGGGASGFGSGMMSPVYNQPGPQQSSMQNANGGITGMQQQAPIHKVYCSNCSKTYESSSKFCPHCGNVYRPCPKCGSDNKENATRCISCGTSLVSGGAISSSVCPKCGSHLAVGTSFCPNCGQQVQTQPADRCPNCGASTGNAKFCPNCGKKLRN